ncbi:MAG: hypothetical protein QXH14_08435 [Candidatus Caldarchaeum sp.]
MRECCQNVENLVVVLEPEGRAYAVCAVCGAKHYTMDLPVVRYQAHIEASG